MRISFYASQRSSSSPAAFVPLATVAFTDVAGVVRQLETELTSLMVINLQASSLRILSDDEAVHPAARLLLNVDPMPTRLGAPKHAVAGAAPTVAPGPNPGRRATLTRQGSGRLGARRLSSAVVGTKAEAVRF